MEHHPSAGSGGVNVSRRGFVAGSAVLAGAAAAGLFSTSGWVRPAEADETAAEERIAYTFHQDHCGGPCGMKCTVRDGRLALIEPNDWPDDHYSTICLKGLAEVQHVYSTERLQKPLKRVGERGSGEFVEITWDEAIDTICDTIKDLQAKHGPECVQVDASGEAHFPLLASVLGAQENPEFHGIDMGGANGFDPAFGSLAWAKSTNELSDWPNSRTIILFGSNQLESSLPDDRWFFEAKDAGAHIISVDPLFTTTAAKSHEWIPIEPGTDAACLLAMASTIIDNNWHDTDFLLKNTSMPFLVSDADGRVLREHADQPATTPEEQEANRPLVWDKAANAAKPFDEAADPALEGSFTVDGKPVKTQFTLTLASLKDCTLDWAAEKTGIPAERIAALAERYATGGPASLGYGQGGLDKYANGDVGGHAVALLGALTGNIGRVGGGVGYYGKHRTVHKAKFANWKLPKNMVPADPTNNPMEFPAGNTPIRAYINIGDSFHMRFGDYETTKKWLDTLDFIVTIDPFHVPSVDFSDIVLPVCTRFELNEDFGYTVGVRNHVLLQQKVLDPLFESKTDFEVERLICERFVDDASVLPKTLVEYTRHAVDDADHKTMQGITVDTLLEANCILPLNVPPEPIIRFEDQKYDTPSGKLELYYEDMVPFGQALPTYEEPLEASAAAKASGPYPLQFSQPRTKFHVHCQFCDATWIQQYYEPTIELNPKDGEARGLTSGERVEAYNDRGTFACTYRPNPAVRPGTCIAFEGMWSKYMDAGDIQSVTNASITERGMNMPYGPVIPFNDTLVEVRRAEGK